MEVWFSDFSKRNGRKTRGTRDAFPEEKNRGGHIYMYILTTYIYIHTYYIHILYTYILHTYIVYIHTTYIYLHTQTQHIKASFSLILCPKAS